ACKALPAFNNYVAIKSIDFHDKRATTDLFGGNQSRAAATKQIQHMLARPRRVLQGPDRQFYRLLREMNHPLGIDLLDQPDVSGVGRAEKAMGRALSPAIKAPFVIAHEVFPG